MRDQMTGGSGANVAFRDAPLVVTGEIAPGLVFPWAASSGCPASSPCSPWIAPAGSCSASGCAGMGGSAR